MNMREGFVQPGAAPTTRPISNAVEHESTAPGLPPSPGPLPPEIEPSPAEVPQAAPVTEVWPKVCKILHRQIFNERGEPIKQVSLREPRAADINRWGNPCRLSNEGEIIIDERKMTFMISALSGILPQIVEMMDPRDWNSVAYRLRPFFLPELEAWL
jgi:hypothetical protein